MQLLRFLLRLSPGWMVIAVLAGIACGVSSVLIIALINLNLHRASAAPQSAAFWFLFLCVLTVTARLASDLVLIRLTQKTVYEIRSRISQQILGVPLRHLELVGGHAVLAAMTEDVGTLTELVMLIPSFSINAAIVVGCLIYLGTLSGVITIFLISTMLVAIVVYQLIGGRAGKHFERARRYHDVLVKAFCALTQGVKEMKLNSVLYGQCLLDVKCSAQQVYRHLIFGLSLFVGAMTLGQTLFFALIFVLVFEMPRSALYAKQPQGLTAAILVLLVIKGPLESVVGIVPSLSRAQVSLAKVEQLGLSFLEQASPSEQLNLADMRSLEPVVSIELASAMYKYTSEDSEPFALGPIDMIIRAGETVFIAGGNGSGKTTLAKLLTGLYLPQSGELRFNGARICHAHCQHFRSHFAAVFSDFYLSATLPYEPTQERDAVARQYLKMLRLDRKVTINNGVLSTTNLSHGQRKRLALLAAFVQDRPVYVFDEWAADQDMTFRKLFYCDLLPQLRARGKTVLVISHDQQFYHAADRVIFLDEGRIQGELTAEVRSISTGGMNVFPA